MLKRLRSKITPSNKTIKKVNFFVDKHRLVLRSFQVGIVVNAYFTYDALKRRSVLKKLQNHIIQKNLEYEIFVQKQDEMISKVIRNSESEYPGESAM